MAKNGKTNFIVSFLGGYGPGSYYYPIMIQFVFYFPILFQIVKKYDEKGLKICFLMNLVYEILQCAYGLGDACYRLIVCRYTFVIAFGIYFAIGKKQISRATLFKIMLFGMAYIILFVYIGKVPLFTIHWTGTSLWACLYVLPLVCLMLRLNICNWMIEMLGKASYNIFLTQMVYYSSGIGSDLFTIRMHQMMFNILICCIIGVIFYYIEFPITKYIREKVKTFFEE